MERIIKLITGIVCSVLAGIFFLQTEAYAETVFIDPNAVPAASAAGSAASAVPAIASTASIGRLQLLNSKNFDAGRYAAENPDVAAIVGTKKKSLYDHYCNIGIYEGRPAWSTSQATNQRLRAYDVLSAITNIGMSETEKIRAVHDWIICNTIYNMPAYETDSYSPSDFTADGPLFMGTAVCGGYSEAFKVFMDVLGLPSRVATGYAGGGLHGWNEVNVAGQWLAIDVTWDDPVPDTGGVYWYKYFLISREEMALDHTLISYDG